MLTLANKCWQVLHDSDSVSESVSVLRYLLLFILSYLSINNFVRNKEKIKEKKKICHEINLKRF